MAKRETGRRSEECNGFVNFPVHDPRYENSREGGVFVMAVVLEDEDFDKRWPICFGGYSYFPMAESLIDDSENPRPKPTEPPTSLEDMDREREAHDAWEGQLFPFMRNTSPKIACSLERYISVPLLVSVLLGSTGWSGWDTEAGEYWKATRDSLTQEGLGIVTALEALYGKKVHLLTWLDT